MTLPRDARRRGAVVSNPADSSDKGRDALKGDSEGLYDHKDTLLLMVVQI
jgi:hypothetical protein